MMLKRTMFNHYAENRIKFQAQKGHPLRSDLDLAVIAFSMS